MSTRLVPNPTTRCQFYIEYVQHQYKIDRTSTETMLNRAAGAAPPAAETGLSNIYRSVAVEGVSGGCGPSNINETIISWCAHKITIYLMLAGSDHPRNRACRD